ncbi:MAG: FliM/FliN family flagellar motor switch protein [Paracoccaceae bacterium]
MDVANALRRKVSGQRVGRAPIPGIEEIGENFAKLLDERLRQLMRTISSAIVIDCEVRKLSSVLEDIPVPAMLAVVSVRDSQYRALINIGMDLLFHAVDLRMGGDPSAAPQPIARSITAVDCGLCEAMIEAMIEAFEGSLRLNLAPGLAPAMRLEHFEQHVTMVRIAPEHSDVLVLRLSLDMGEAARSGDFEFVLPLALLDSYRAAAPAKGGEGARSRTDFWSRHMAQAAREAPVRLAAVLHRERRTLAELQTLAPGDLLPLPPEARERVELRLVGRGAGETFAQGRLGAIEGEKAVKLTSEPDRGRLEALKAALQAPEGP